MAQKLQPQRRYVKCIITQATVESKYTTASISQPEHIELTSGLPRVGKGPTAQRKRPQPWGQAEAVLIRTPDGRGLVRVRAFPALDTAKYRRFQSSCLWICSDRTFY
jgi:hypothetical protein